MHDRAMTKEFTTIMAGRNRMGAEEAPSNLFLPYLGLWVYLFNEYTFTIY
jgi:hypothetical protein